MAVAPELLYLLTGDPAEFAELVRTMQPADVAEALRALTPDVAARVLVALPFDAAVLVLDDPDLADRLEIVRAMDAHTFGPLLSAMSADQQAELFREMPEAERSRFRPSLHPKAREALEHLAAEGVSSPCATAKRSRGDVEDGRVTFSLIELAP